MQRKYRRLREEAYREGLESFAALSADPTFRDFVCLYVAEGYKRSRNTVSIVNADPAVIRVAALWIDRFSERPISYAVSHHRDQDPAVLRRFWASLLVVPADSIACRRKSNSGELAGRTWRSEHGLLTIKAHDTRFRARLQAWIDCVKREWALERG